MLYNTGTIAINGNTATGTGTNWAAPASQVRAGQTIIVMSNPVQMFQISSVNSATSMTVTPAASPALSGQKYGILVSDNISVDGLAQAMSQLIKEYDENIGAWETFATTSANQSITVTINGTPVTIPGIGKLAQKGPNGALPIDQGGTGATTAEGSRANLGLGYGDTAGTVCQGNDSRLNTLDGKTGGSIAGSVTVKSPNTSNTTEIYPGALELYSTTPVIDFHYNNSTADFTTRISEDASGELTVKANGIARFGVNGGYRTRAGLTGSNGGNHWNFNWVSGQLRAYVDTSDLGAISFSSSDRELKQNIIYCDEEKILEAFNEVMKWQPATFNFKPRGVVNDEKTHLGFIANDLHRLSPLCVTGEGLPEGSDIETDISSAFSLEYAAMIANLTMALQHQQRLIEKLENQLSTLTPATS